ncbi:MAG: hypothetical protein JW837_10995 [Sedimentisphaerales bacterium]|nr:hypothetical protein [Sedimentisphaerales bacterium]
MEKRKSTFLLLCMCTTCFFNGVQAQGKSASKENFDENKVTIKLGALRIKKCIDTYHVRGECG